ncbi:MAG: hypothetical protein AAB373_05275 [Patescibacteria group bacterium]
MSDTNFQQSEEEQQAQQIFDNADNVYGWVMSRLNIDPENEVYYELVLGMLKRQTRDHILFRIWSSLDDGQAKHLREFLNETSITMPFLNTEDAIMEFAQMYPAVMDKLLKSLDVFFESFIAKFNEISAA